MANSTLKILRELNNYTQEFIAEDVLNTSQATYARIEVNQSKLTAEQAKKLALLYKVNVAHLLSEDIPVLIFKDVESDSENSSINIQLATTLKALQTQNELLIQQNTELVRLMKLLHHKANNLVYE